MELWYSLVELLPFDWAQSGGMYFMKNALLAVLVISPLFGILSTMVVHSRMSFFSDALGHSAFTGMAIGAICGFNEPTWAAVAFAVVFALLFNWVRRRSALASDTVIGVFSSYRRRSGYLYLYPGRALLYQIQRPAHRRYSFGRAGQDRLAGGHSSADYRPLGGIL